MATSQTLQQQYQECALAMRKLVDDSEADDREFSAEEQAKFNEYRANIESLEKRIESLQVVERGLHVYESDEEREADDREAWERRKNDTPAHEGDRLTTDDRLEGLRCWMLGAGQTTPEQQALAARCGWNVHATEIELRPAPKRRRLSGSEEERAQSVGTDSAGGYTVPDEMMAELSKTMVRFGGVRAACRVVSTATGADFPWPTVNDTSNSGAILAENAADGETDVTVGQVVFNAYHVTSDMVRVSFQLLQDAAFSWDGILGELLGERVGRGENALLTTGTGSAQHNGIVTAAADSGVTAAAAAALTWSEVLQLIHSVDPDYRTDAALMCNDTTLRILREISDSQNRPLWNADLSAGAPGTFAGHRIVVNQQMASGSSSKALLFGDMQQYVVRSVQGLTLRRSDHRYFENFQTAFLASIRSDGDIIQSSAIKYLTMGL